MNEAKERIIKSSYPYPIVSAFRQIKPQIDIQNKLDKTLEAAEAVLRFISSIVLCELRKYYEENKSINLPAGFKNDFAKNFKRPSFGIWLAFAREGMKWLIENNVSLTIPEMKTIFFNEKMDCTEFYNYFEKIIQLRNAIMHGKLEKTDDKIQKAFEVANSMFEVILESLDFFLKIESGIVEKISVKKVLRKEPQFIHVIMDLNGDEITNPKELNYKNFRDSGSVLIKYEDTDRCLNLFPFYIYETGKTKDIFYYNSFINENSYNYMGCYHGGKLAVDGIKKEKENVSLDDEFDMLLGKKEGESSKGLPEVKEELEYFLGFIK